MCRSCFAVLMLLTASCEPGGGSSPAKQQQPAAKPAAKAADPCVTIRADYYWQEQRWLLLSAGAGNGAINPAAMAMLARFKLDNPTCFF